MNVDHKALLVQKAKKVTRENVERPDPKEPKAKLERQAQRAIKAIRVSKDPKVKKGIPEPRV